MSEEHFEVSVDDEVDVDDNVDDDKPGDDKPGDDEKPGDEKPEPEDPAKLLKDQVTKLESEKKNLNVALHQARQERKSKKTVDGEQLTDDQVEELIKEHGDDPKVLRNVVQYIAEQSTKGQIGIQETAQLRKDTAGYVAERWPDMVDESSELFKRVGSARGALRIENHPMADYLALSTLICEELPAIQKQAFEQGRVEGLKGIAEKGRKKKVKENILTPAGSTFDGADTKLTGKMSETVKQMGLSKAQQKIYARLVSKGKQDE